MSLSFVSLTTKSIIIYSSLSLISFLCFFSAFGPTFLATLASCLLHLVATTYFLLVEIVGEKDAVFSWLQALWLTVHFLRLVLIVEPCHMTYKEARKTTFIVCEIQRNCKDPNVKASVCCPRVIEGMIIYDSPGFSFMNFSLKPSGNSYSCNNHIFHRVDCV